MSAKNRYTKKKSKLYDTEYTQQEIKSLAEKLQEWGNNLSLPERQLLELIIARAEAYDKNEQIVFFDKTIKERTTAALKPFASKVWAVGRQDLRAELAETEDEDFWAQWAERQAQ